VLAATGDEHISTFEFLQSGALEALTDHLAGESK
jgi:hypothetical protein